MIRISITDNEKKVLKNYCHYLFEAATLTENEANCFIEFIDYEEFSSALTADIINVGMNNQDVVNDIGRELYAIHDRIYYYE